MKKTIPREDKETRNKGVRQRLQWRRDAAARRGLKVRLSKDGTKFEWFSGKDEFLMAEVVNPQR
jgi:hypothetical protein